MSSLINGFIIFSLIITCAYFVGLLKFINDYEPNKCEMTYMFEYPQYVRISQEIDEKYQKYGLYAYSEGRFTERSRNMYFDGIPVLFIPGNAGSHRQARGMASIALRKAVNSRSPYHFDFFGIDINNEFSGLNGALLFDQLEYANASIFKILDLYRERKNRPNSIIIYAHSAGGIIARRLVESFPEESNLISVVFTLATPHKRPPLLLDSYTRDFYKELNSSRSFNTTFVSLTGGYNDFLVPSYLTSLTYQNAINVATTHVPLAWVTSDHICITWCKQTLLALNRALFNSVDPKTKQISTDPQFRQAMFHHHLVKHNGLNPVLSHSYPSKANIRNQGEWIEYMGRQYIIRVPRQTKTPMFYMLRLLNQPQHRAVTVVALNLETVEWAFVCGAHIPRETARVCEEFTHLSHLSEISPSNHYKRRSLRVDMHELMKTDPAWTHVVLRTLPSDDEVVLNVDVYNPDERKLVVNLPHMLSLKRRVLINETLENIVHFELELPQLTQIIQSYQLSVESLQCKYESRHATASLIVPWNHQSQHKHFVKDDSQPMHVRLFEPKPQGGSENPAVIRLTLDPNCRYKISIQSSILGFLSQVARFYSPLLVVNVAVVVLMTLNAQMQNIAENKSCSLFFVAIKEGAKPYYILTSVKLISRVLSAKAFGNLPSPDWLMMSQEGTDFFLLPLLLYICSVGIVWLLGIILSISLVVSETTVHKFTLKLLAKTMRLTVGLSDYVMSALHKLPFVVAAMLVCLSLTTTGGLALCLGAVFYFMRLTQLSQDYIEELVWYYIKKIIKKFKREPREEQQNETPSSSNEKEETPPPNEDKENENPKKDPGNNNNSSVECSAHNAVYFHTTIFFLWCLLTIINVPSVLTWAHNFQFSTMLKPDPAFFPGLLLSICALPLWQMDLPKIERKGYKEVGQFIYVLAVASLIYAPISIFRLNYILTTAIVVLTVHQLVAPNRDLTAPSRPPDYMGWYETMKAKLE